MIITTLPITPGKHNSFVTLFGPLIADVFSKLTGEPFKMILNVFHSFNSFDDFVDQYVNQLKRLDIQPVIECDNCISYQKLVGEIVEDLMHKGFLTIEKVKMLYCGCGVVELPFSVYKLLCKQDRYKYICQNKCVNCGDVLKIERNTILNLTFPVTEPKVRVRSLYKNRFNDAYKTLEGRPLIISRNHRNGLKVLLNNHPFTLDTDFCWMIFLLYFNDKEFSVISGADTINHSAKVVKMLNIYKPEAKINLIIHPLLKFFDSKIKISEFTINKYLDYCKTPQFARTFLLLCTQWRQPEVLIQASNLYLVEKSINPRQKFSSIDSPQIVTPKNFYSTLNSNKVLELLKIMRSHKTKLSGDQATLKNVLFG